MRRMIECCQEHFTIIVRIAALDVIFPNHLVSVQLPVCNKQLVLCDEILIYKIVNKHEIGKVFTDLENKVTAFFCVFIIFFS